MDTRGCQVFLEYQEVQASVENLDQWATLVCKANKGLEDDLVYPVLLEWLAAV